MFQGLSLLAQDPASVLAHDGESVDHHRLATGEDRTDSATVELPR